MIDLVTEMMQSKVELPGGRPSKNLPRIQNVIADAEMILGAARSYVFSAIERQWKRIEHREVPTEKERADAWLKPHQRRPVRTRGDQNALRRLGWKCDLFEKESVGSRASRRRNLVPTSRGSTPNPRMGRRAAPQIGRPTSLPAFVGELQPCPGRDSNSDSGQAQAMPKPTQKYLKLRITVPLAKAPRS
jgi:hypothetical protein